MKLLTIRTDKEEQLGISTKKGILNVTEKFPNFPDVKAVIKNSSIHELINLHDKALKDDELKFLNEGDLDIGPCVTDPGKIICVGLNYRKHAEESGAEIPKSPILFNKYNNTLAGHKESIKLPNDSTQVDYEAELAIVIGKETKEISKEHALEHVFGYSTANDLTARDLQFRTNQWLLGKNLDGFCPLGPYLVTADEIENPNSLDISCTINGEVRQKSNTKDMIFYCDEIVSYISHYMTLNPGDVILTGTPEGVVLGLEESEQVWLADGDEIEVEVEGLGKLHNIIRKRIEE
ncbi:fumarylacetoacetate hydrolase family protein [Virgibacillus sp. NKC19-3]|uniref:fumarylacetoacetate hydrolase family protein n=1 Tax=Virgibacillus saliphilus TaxID=2831674 RepID=UPI001C9B76C3|nr:fumarylacetoacetate hydrolase family protein [Virgibacillus sp. NKC19-3]MBY7142834.1 fumarylacetoacetate hydrolase family protein [Virgibacillus sp. NKC19-3]